MRLEWADEARFVDLPRLAEFPGASADAIRALAAAPELLLTQPRMGAPLHSFEPREVRRWIVQNYEIRYELTADRLIILRVFHTRENRLTH